MAAAAGGVNSGMLWTSSGASIKLYETVIVAALFFSHSWLSHVKLEWVRDSPNKICSGKSCYFFSVKASIKFVLATVKLIQVVKFAICFSCQSWNVRNGLTSRV